jgi:phage tail tape-measure protein
MTNGTGNQPDARWPIIVAAVVGGAVGGAIGGYLGAQAGTSDTEPPAQEQPQNPDDR